MNNTNQHFDAIVVGLGAMGSASLYQLARRKMRVLGIDRFSPPHTKGSTHGETRVTRLAIGEGTSYVPLVIRSHELWREIEQATGESLLTQNGGLIIGKRHVDSRQHGVDNFLLSTIAAAEEFDIDHDTLEAGDVRRRFPQFKIDDDESAYFEPAAGFVRPEKCVAAQLSLAQQQGAEIWLETIVDQFDVVGKSKVTVDTATRGRVTAEQLVLTSGAWIGNFLPNHLSQWFKVYAQIQYWFRLQVKSQFDASQFPIFICVTEHDHDMIYGFPMLDSTADTIKVAAERYDTTISADDEPTAVSEAIITAMNRRVTDRIKGLTGEITRMQSCLYTCTNDFGFVIDHHPEYDNVLLVSPCSGHGFKHSAAIGEAAAELITQGSSRLDLRPFRLKRLQSE